MAAPRRFPSLSALLLLALFVTVKAARNQIQLKSRTQETEHLQSLKNSSTAEMSDEEWLDKHTFDDPEEVVKMVEMLKVEESHML